MPLVFDLDESRALVRTTADGVVNDEDMIRHVRALAEVHQKCPYKAELIDLRQIVIGEVTGEAVRQTAEIVSSSPGLRTVDMAFVATEDVVFGLSRMFEMLQVGHEGRIRVFRDMESAEEWLGMA